jgi:hypothetical protein
MDRDSLFQKTPIIAPKKKKNEPFSQEKHLKIPLLSRGLKMSYSKPVVESELFTSLYNRYHLWLLDIELIQMSAISSFSSHN